MKNYFWLFLSVIWSGLILYLSFFNPISDNASNPWFENQDKVGHLLFYAVFSFILIKMFSLEIIVQNSVVLGATVAFIFGVLIEFSQHFFTLDRDGNFFDAFANGLGVLFQVILIKSFPDFFYHNTKK